MKEPILEQERYPGISPPFKIVIIYTLGAFTGLLLPDELLRAIITNPTTLTRLEILIACTFTVTMAWILYVLIQRTLAADQERYRALIHNVMDSSAAGSMVLDANFRVVWANQALAQYFDIPRTEMLRKDTRRLVQEQLKDLFEEPQRYSERVLAALDDNTYIDTFECHVLPGPNREERWLEHWSQPIRTGVYAGGRVVHYTDITERRRNEERLRLIVEGTSPVTGQAFFCSLVRHLAAALQVRFAFVAEQATGDGGRFRMISIWNGTDYDESYEYGVRGIPCEPTSAQGIVYLPTGAQQLFPENERLLHSGVESYLAIPLSDSQGHVQGIMGVMDDKPMSARMPDLSILKIFAARAGAELERNRVEQKARQHEAELAHMARLNIMGEMATGLAHELNQPLSAIVNYTHGCVRRLRQRGDSNAELLAVLEQVCTQAERAGEIIRRVRTFVRKQGPQRTRVDINALIREVASFIESDVNRDRIMLRFEPAEGLAPVIADKIQIEQVVLNLLRNAIDAMKSAASHRRELILRTEPRDNGTVEVSVSDSGIGIPADMVERVFEPFVSNKRDGMGMGLSISRSIIDTHGGRLWTEPRPGGGSVFRFTLPIERN